MVRSLALGLPYDFFDHIVAFSNFKICFILTRFFCPHLPVAAILELNEHRNASFKIFEAAPQNERGVPQKKPAPDYFL